VTKVSNNNSHFTGSTKSWWKGTVEKESLEN